MQIGDKRVGPGEPTYIVAELSANALGDFDCAAHLVEAAAVAAADSGTARARASLDLEENINGK